jgi:hypothetical protein
MSHPPATPGSSLCDACEEALRFDDARCGGFVGRAPKKGTPKLKFENESGEAFRQPKILGLMRQERTDSSPDFPTLAKSAAAGCSACGFLRTAILRANIQTLESRGEVGIDLYYAWCYHGAGFEDDPHAERRDGLHTLFVDLFSASEDMVGTLRFHVYSSDGASPLIGVVVLSTRH